MAQWKAQQAGKRPKSAELTTNPSLRNYAEQRLSGTVTDADARPVLGPNVPWGRTSAGPTLGHETIYQSAANHNRGTTVRRKGPYHSCPLSVPARGLGYGGRG